MDTGTIAGVAGHTNINFFMVVFASNRLLAMSAPPIIVTVTEDFEHSIRRKIVIDYATDSNTVAKTYTWGLDLSGSVQGAGGVGGLLSVTVHSDTGDSAYYPSYDANGNVSEYVDDSDSVVAHYEYSPFGKITSSSGSKSSDFRHRFSTKYLDDETALYYYGYRYYSSELGRWLSRDPIQEEGGLNLYVFVGNAGIDRFDVLGLKCTLLSGPDVKEGAEWKLSGAETFGFSPPASGAISINGMKANWKLEGSVKCCCSFWFFRREKEKATYKVHNEKKRLENPGIVGIMGGNPALSIPTPKSIEDAIAEIVGQTISLPVITDEESAKELAELVAATKPTSKDEGKWPDDPCN